MQEFNILHISDLHLSAKPKGVNPFLRLTHKFSWSALSDIKNMSMFTSHDPDLLISLKRHIYLSSLDTDIFLLTGDISTTGFEDEISASFNILENIFEYEKGLQRLVLLPGNHDRFKDLTATPSCVNFDKYFGKYWPAGKKVNCKIFQQENEKLAIVAVDLCLSDEKDCDCAFGQYGQGKVYNDTICELERLLSKLKSHFAGIPCLIAIHFNPLYSDKYLKLIDSNNFIDVIIKHNIKYIFCGHTHSNCISTDPVGINIINIGSATSYNESENSFNRIKVFVDQNNIDKIDIITYKRNELQDDFYINGSHSF